MGRRYQTGHGEAVLVSRDHADPCVAVVPSPLDQVAFHPIAVAQDKTGLDDVRRRLVVREAHEADASPLSSGHRDCNVLGRVDFHSSANCHLLAFNQSGTRSVAMEHLPSPGDYHPDRQPDVGDLALGAVPEQQVVQAAGLAHPISLTGERPLRMPADGIGSIRKRVDGGRTAVGPTVRRESPGGASRVLNCGRLLRRARRDGAAQ